jgi:hypothetical protein
VTRHIETTDLTTLVPTWLTLQEVGDQLGVSPNRVRQLARERQLALIRLDGEARVPADFLQGKAPVKGLGGTLVVLADHGFDEAESIRCRVGPSTHCARTGAKRSAAAPRRSSDRSDWVATTAAG